MLHLIVMTENSKRKTIYRKIRDVSYNSKERVHKGWIRYKGKELRVELVDSEWRIDRARSNRSRA